MKNRIFWIIAAVAGLMIVSIWHASSDHFANDRIREAELTRDSLVIDSMMMANDTTLLNHSEIEGHGD